MAAIQMKELLEAGVHFGHQTKRWNPKMKKYIFGARNSIYIIDLQKTLRLWNAAATYITKAASQGKTFMFVATKPQAQEVVAEQAARCGAFYVNNRWLGGMLTSAGVPAFDGNNAMPAGLFGEFRQHLYDYYGGANAVSTGWVSNTLFEPHIGDSIF